MRYGLLLSMQWRSLVGRARPRSPRYGRAPKAEARQRSEAGGRKPGGSDVNARWELVLVGDGALKGNLCRLISDLRLPRHVHFPGFRQYDELPVYYAIAKAFLHASTTEQWGLVV